MDAKEIERRISRVKDEIQKEVTDRLPRKVGVVAANHFKQNFRDGGFTDGGVHQWKRTKRQDGNTTDAKYSPLTSAKNQYGATQIYNQIFTLDSLGTVISISDVE